MIRLFIMFLIALGFNVLIGQNRVDIRFSPISLGEMKSCFDFELKSLENSDFMIAGQNYRIYFDSQKLDLVSDELRSYGDKKLYSNLRSLRKHHSDDIHVTMINLAVDALEYDKEKLILLKPQQWTKTSSACFTHIKDAQFKLTWARAKETSELATAYVTLSEWQSDEMQTQVMINDYYDFDKGQIVDNQHFQADITIYPNPVVDLVNLEIGRFGEMEKGKMIIVDIAGNMIKTLDINKGTSAYQVDMKDAPEGSYFLEILNEREENIYHSAFMKSSL